ncbi:unnamed protein product, partial [Ascophyllum nodosum]
CFNSRSDVRPPGEASSDNASSISSALPSYVQFFVRSFSFIYQDGGARTYRQPRKIPGPGRTPDPYLWESVKPLERLQAE